jgi:hypothetical protein
MDPSDLLQLAAQAAQAIRCAGDLDTGLASGYQFLGLPAPKDRKDPPALRIVRLMHAAGDRKADLLRHLWALRKSEVLLANRPAEEPTEELLEPDAEALRLHRVINSSKYKRIDILGGFPSFSIVGRMVAGTYGGKWVSSGGWTKYKPEGLPETVRGLITYPLAAPVVFPINVGKEPWLIWDICCAFAEQYARIYEHPRRHGVWGHDIGDLWLEGLIYFPKEKLIHAYIGS